jgi:hypothetical protein
MKFHHRYAHLLFSLLMSMIVAFIVTFVLTAVNHGYQDFIANWAHSFVIAWTIAFAAVLIISPRVHKLVKWLTAHSPH